MAGGTVGIGGLTYAGVEILKGLGLTIDPVLQSAIVTFATGLAGFVLPLIIGRTLRSEVWPDAHVQQLTVPDVERIDRAVAVPEQVVGYYYPADDTATTVSGGPVVYDPVTGDPVTS